MGTLNLQSDSVLSLNQLSFGFLNAFSRKNNNNIQLKLGYNHIWVDDNKNAVKSIS
jgi:hypothetical protein